MANNSFWDTYKRYWKFKTIVPIVVLIILAIALIVKVLLDKFLN